MTMQAGTNCGKSYNYEYGVKGKLLRAIQALYVDGRAKVKIGKMDAEVFGVHRGVR